MQKIVPAYFMPSSDSAKPIPTRVWAVFSIWKSRSNSDRISRTPHVSTMAGTVHPLAGDVPSLPGLALGRGQVFMGPAA